MVSSRLPRLRRALPLVVGLVVTAQLAAVAHAGMLGVRPDVPLVPPGSSSTTIPEVDEPGRFSVDAGPVVVDVSLPELSAAGASTGQPCGPNDRAETGIQGDVPLADQLSGRASEGYNCGIDVVGYSSLDERGGNANLAWAGDCAFVSGDGIAVVDVSDPANPVYVTTLTTSGSLNSLETMVAGSYGGRSILAASRYGWFVDFGLSGGAPLDLWDVTDCRNPRLLSSTKVPPGIHNLTLSPDLSRIWTSLPVQAFDISDPTAPRYLGNLEDQLRAAGVFQLEFAHEVTVAADGSRIYIGGQVVGDERSLIVDVANWPAQPPRVISHYDGPGHSINTATIDDRPFLVRSDESIVPFTGTSCLPDELTPVGGTSNPRLTDVSDETRPTDRGQLLLDIQDPANCVPSLLSGVNPSVHYQNVDDPADTTFVMASMWNSGLRIFDVRNPDAPGEVAYFNPGQFPVVPLASGGGSIDRLFGVLAARTSNLDQTWGHVRYDPADGRIWLVTRTGGFWVLQLQPQVRERLGLPALPALAPLEGSPRPAASIDVRPPRLSESTAPQPIYCTLGSLGLL